METNFKPQMLKVGDKVRANMPFNAENYSNGTAVVDGIDITPSMQEQLDGDKVYTIRGFVDGGACELEETPSVFWPNSIFGKVKSKNLEYIESVIPMCDVNFMRKTNGASRTWFIGFKFAIFPPFKESTISNAHIITIEITGDKRNEKALVISKSYSANQKCAVACLVENIDTTVFDLMTTYAKNTFPSLKNGEEAEFLLIDKNNIDL